MYDDEFDEYGCGERLKHSLHNILSKVEREFGRNASIIEVIGSTRFEQIDFDEIAK